MAKIVSNGLTLEVEQHGKKSDPAVLLIMGLAAQLTRWPDDFIAALVSGGFRVIAFDNRDIGLSEKLDAERAPSPATVVLLDKVGLASLVAPYKLTDMATDTLGLLDALEIERAHVIGASMGGMIGQILCAEHARRIKSFTAIMSSTNNPNLPKAHPAITKEILTGRTQSSTREELIESTLRIWNIIGTKNSGRDAQRFRQHVADSVDRNSSPAGIRRQIAAIIATRDLREWTRKISAPSLVIHGSDDPLVPLQCGLDIAATIENARMEVVEGMGHDLPPRLLTAITTPVLNHLRSVEKSVDAVQAA
jgi:pimeloyl-ACP methyl ester carboxylesterase